MTLALQLLTYNGARFLPALFESLENQTDKDWILYVQDNASAPEERVAVRALIEAWKNRLPIVYREEETNLGFAGGHQKLFEAHQAELILLVNQDVILGPTYIEQTRAAFIDPKIAAAEGIILRFDLDETGRPVTSNMVDSLGLKRTRWQAVSDIGAGTEFSADSKTVFDVFGVSGCLPMYRRRAIATTDPNGRLFDPTYFLYKEDVDVAYRLQRAGVRAVIVPTATAWHHRSFKPGARAKVSTFSAYLSYRNHWWNILIHASTRDAVPMAAYELAKAGYVLMHHPSFFGRALVETKKRWPSLMARRHFLSSLKPTRYSLLATHQPHFDVAIIMTTYNKLIPGCLASVRKAMESSSFKTCFVLVDNKSTAFDADEVAKEIPSAIVIRSGKNGGFGRGCNRGASEVSARAYLMLNPDTIMHDTKTIDTLFAFLQTNPHAGIVAPRIRYPDGSLQETCRRFPPWHVPLLRRTSLAKNSWSQEALDEFLMRDFDHASPRLVDWVQGSALLIDGKLFHQLGGFDERFFMYYEDVDLCRRAWLARRPVYYLPAVELMHEYGRGSKDGGVIKSLLRSTLARHHIASWITYTFTWGEKPVHPK